MPKIDQIPWERTEESSNVHSLYRHPDGTICVKFNSGGLYTYIGAPVEVYLDLRHAQSVGGYLNKVIKQYPYTRWDTENTLLDHLNIVENTHNN